MNYPIPGNDDARRSIDLYCDLMKETIKNAKSEAPKNEAPSNIEKKLETSVKKNVVKTIKEIDRRKIRRKVCKKRKNYFKLIWIILKKLNN